MSFFDDLLGYKDLYDDGVLRPRRSAIDFLGVPVTDNPTTLRTEVDVGTAITDAVNGGSFGTFTASILVATDHVESGGGTMPIVGAYRMANNKYLYGRGVTATSVRLLGVDASDRIQFGANLANLAGALFDLPSAASGYDFRLGSQTKLLVANTEVQAHRDLFLHGLAQVIARETLADAATSTLTIHGQDNNSATFEAGDLDIRPGANAGTESNGVLRLMDGNGNQQIEITDNTIAFFSGSGSTQPADIGALTDNTGGTADGTLVDVGAAYSQATLNNNFADIAQRINALRDALRATSYMA